MKHGGDLGEAAVHYGGEPEEWLDLSTGINPHFWAVGKLPSSVWQCLPRQRELEALNKAARIAYHVPDNLGICAAPGTEAILSRLPQILSSGAVAVVSPTYSSHSDAWRNDGRTVHPLDPGSQIPADCRIGVIVNPNNPDGQVLSVDYLLQMAEQLAQRNGSLIVDEAFCDVAPTSSIIPHIDQLPILVLRSFGKFFGLAGLRLGFLIGSQSVAQTLERQLGGWAISGPALQIGIAALSSLDWQIRMRQQLKKEADELDTLFHSRNLAVAGGTDLFRLIDSQHAQEIHKSLAERHIWTRIFDYNKKWIRFGLPGSNENFERLANALS
ncbi:MAG: threonine-phosphate decarboxylase CobD [Stappiaceae bacterium]